MRHFAILATLCLPLLLTGCPHEKYDIGMEVREGKLHRHLAIEKVSSDEMTEWQKKYPDAFRREYDPASGLRFDAWIEGGMKKQ